jgi:hypothetical protein
MYDDNQDVGYTYDENIILKSLVIDLAMSGQLPLKISFKIKSDLLDFPVFKDFITFFTSEIVIGLSVVSFIEYFSSLDKKSHISASCYGSVFSFQSP